ncbi:MAG TPA: MupA/Atu3671 family FMN-dependent luciferase-like monooxygenase [Candidatus Dormibacteraeota bacterium]|nr:MupA/Atu3671 family FMN-dependent luciferase-like monooxygenase [Candidatus Dormibacteraeota bacterium]
MKLSFLFFSADSSVASGDRYRQVLDCARFADERGFEAIWTPERHFDDFGGLYPNPSVLGAALAVSTRRVRIRAGSVVLPLHHPVRVAEEWAVVDNLSGGRVDVAFASGWHPSDFVFAPAAYRQRRERMLASLRVVRDLWAGGEATLEGPDGTPVTVAIRPRPVQPRLPVWLTATSRPETFAAAADLGCGVLTALVGQPLDRLAENVRLYRSRYRPSDPDAGGGGHVTLMLHTFVGTDNAHVKRSVREPLQEYVRGYLAQHERFASRLGSATERQREALAALAFDHYYRSDSLLGTPAKCRSIVAQAAAAGVDEIACLIDFGLPQDEVLASLELLDGVRREVA